MDDLRCFGEPSLRTSIIAAARISLARTSEPTVESLIWTKSLRVGRSRDSGRANKSSGDLAV